MNGDILQFFDGQPQALALYLKLEEALAQRVPGLTVRAAATQISFYARLMFACVSLPRKKAERGGLRLSFVQPAPLDSPRIEQAVFIRPGVYTHHLLLTKAEQIDGELLGWLDAARWREANHR